MDDHAPSPPPPLRTPLAVRLLAVPIVVAGLLAGLWLVSSVIFSTYWGSIAGGVAWFVLASVILGKLTKRRPDLRRFTRGAFLVTSVLLAFAFYWTSIRETEVNETVVTGTPLSQMEGADAAQAAGPEAGAEPDSEPTAPSGPVQLSAGRVTSLAHSGQGRAAVVELPDGGRRLTLTRFDIDPGPQVEVRLVAGSDPAGRDHRRLGALKGSRGDQQYTIPRKVNLSRYRTVVFWCVPFTQALAQAKLRAS